MREFIRTTPVYFWWRNLKNARIDKSQLEQWQRSSRDGPPPHAVKQAHVLAIAREYGLNTFVETGTLFGDMIEAIRPHFGKIYSIELSAYYHKIASARFVGDCKITIIRGNSGEKIKDVLAELDDPALFWLDAHYSGGTTARGATDTPIMQELEAILDHPVPHVILVDDARCFGTDPAYPTMEHLSDFLDAHSGNWRMAKRDGILFVEPIRAKLDERDRAHVIS